MTQDVLRLVGGLVAAVVVPGVLLHFTTPDDRLAVGMSAGPFAWPRILVAHLVSALPLGLLAASAVRSLPVVAESARGLWVVIALVVAGLATAIFPGIGEGLAESDAGPIAALVVRAFLAFGVVFPWCIVALGSPPEIGPLARPGVSFGLAAATALIPCGLYTDAVMEAKTQQVNELLARDRIARAEWVLTGLCELGSDRDVAKQTPQKLRVQLREVLPRLRQQVDSPLPLRATFADHLDRAELFVRLDRLDDAAALLEGLSPPEADTVSDLLSNLAQSPYQTNVAKLVATVPHSVQSIVPGDPIIAVCLAKIFRKFDRYRATLTLASVHRDRERWAESDALLKPVLDDWLPHAGETPMASAMCRPCIQILVFNAKADHRPQDGLHWLEIGLASFPEHAAEYHFELGLVYQTMGRPGLAIKHFETAAEQNPEEYSERVREPLNQLRMHTPGCFLSQRP